MAEYRCAECAAPARVTDVGVVRSCAHATAAVVADLSAKCEGTGGIR